MTCKVGTGADRTHRPSNPSILAIQSRCEDRRVHTENCRYIAARHALDGYRSLAEHSLAVGLDYAGFGNLAS